MRDVFIRSTLPITLEQILGQLVRSNRWNDITAVYRDLVVYDRLNQHYVEAFEKALGGSDKIQKMHKPMLLTPELFVPTMMLMRRYGPEQLFDATIREDIIRQIVTNGKSPGLISEILEHTNSYEGIEWISDFIFDNLTLIIKGQESKPNYGLAVEAVRRGEGEKLIGALLDCARDELKKDSIDLTEPDNETELLNHLLAAEYNYNGIKTLWLKWLLCETVSHVGLDKTPESFRRIDTAAFEALWSKVVKSDYSEAEIARLYPSSKRLILGESLAL